MVQELQAGEVELEIAEDISVLNPPKGRQRWKIAFSCFGICACYTILMMIVLKGAGFERDLGQANADFIVKSFQFVAKFGVPFGALITVWTGYRFTAIVGSMMIGVSLFVSSFLNKSDMDIICFLVPGLSGFGIALLEASFTVPVLEYFTEKKVVALVLVYSGIIFASVIIGIVIVSRAYHDGQWHSEDEDIEWRILYRYQMIPCCVALLCGAFLKPLDLRLESGDGGWWSTLKSILGFAGFTRSQAYMLIIICAMAFFNIFGKTFPRIGIPVLMKNPKTYELIILPQSPTLGQVIGIIVLFCLRKKEIIFFLKAIFIVNLAVGPLTSIAPFLQYFGLLVTYGMMLGFSESVFDTVLSTNVPEMCGRQHIRIVEGLVGLASALGEILALYSAENIPALMDESKQKYNVLFYLAGAFIVISAILALVSKNTYTTKVEPRHSDQST